MLLAAGYGSVWTVVSLALVASSAELAPTGMPAMRPSLTPLMTGIIVFCAGLVQCSPWKERRLQRCRECIDARSVAISAWWYGCRLGLDCCASCAAPTAVLFVAGLMDTKTMLVIAAAISAERLAPGRLRIARVTGAVALLAGLFICLQAIAATRFGVA